jgi:hypothetical protein
VSLLEVGISRNASRSETVLQSDCLSVGITLFVVADVKQARMAHTDVVDKAIERNRQSVVTAIGATARDT